MATSGTYAWNPAADDVITEAWERIGRTPATLTGDIARSARTSLRGLLDEWVNRGLKLWWVQRATMTLQVGVNDYTLASQVVDVLEAAITIGGSERPMTAIGRTTWAAIPIKSTKAPPTQFWPERQRDAVVLHVYPAPDAAYPLIFWQMNLPQDVGALGQNIDAHRLFTDALMAGLAFRLATKFEPSRRDSMKEDYEQALALATGENRFRGAVTIGIRRTR